jgi:hypothetical protein
MVHVPEHALEDMARRGMHGSLDRELNHKNDMVMAREKEALGFRGRFPGTIGAQRKKHK